MFIPEEDVCVCAQWYCLFTFLSFKLLQSGHLSCLCLVDLRPRGHIQAVMKQLNVSMKKTEPKQAFCCFILLFFCKFAFIFSCNFHLSSFSSVALHAFRL